MIVLLFKMILRHIPLSMMKDHGMCERAVENELRSLKFVPDHFKTQEMCERTVENEPRSLRFVPDHFKTQEMCNEAIEKTP